MSTLDYEVLAYVRQRNATLGVILRFRSSTKFTHLARIHEFDYSNATFLGCGFGFDVSGIIDRFSYFLGALTEGDPHLR